MSGCLKLATVTFKNGSDYALMLGRCANEADRVAKEAIYEGAKILADEVKAGIDTIQGIHEYQMDDLKAALGVTPMKQNKNEDWNAKIGFDGYGSKPTEKYPKGVPNQLLARAIESGTSFRAKTPFVRRALNKRKAEAIKAMASVIETEFEKIRKG